MSKIIDGILTSDPVMKIEGSNIVNEVWKLIRGEDWEVFTELLEECASPEAARGRYMEIINQS